MKFFKETRQNWKIAKAITMCKQLGFDPNATSMFMDELLPLLHKELRDVMDEMGITKVGDVAILLMWEFIPRIEDHSHISILYQWLVMNAVKCEFSGDFVAHFSQKLISRYAEILDIKKERAYESLTGMEYPYPIEEETKEEEAA